MPQVVGLAVSALTGGGIFGAVGQLLAGVALSALSQVVFAQDAPKGPGVVTQSTTRGETTPQSIMLGRYATEGNLAAPVMKAEGKWHTIVVDLSDHAIEGVTRLYLDGEEMDFGLPDGTVINQHTSTSLGEHDAGNGFAAQNAEYRGSKGQPLVYVRVFDGRQTEADPILLAKHGAEEKRPWKPDMRFRGVPYAVVEAYVGGTKEKVLRGIPGVRFEVQGAALYDPRRDGSVGGSGPHRWGQPGTYEYTANPPVMIYNILRGIELEDGSVFGGKSVAAEDLPLDIWIPQMDRADERVGIGGGKVQARYEAGYEIRMATGTPGVNGQTAVEVVQELLKACDGRVAEVAGSWIIRCGRPDAPILSITDADVIVSAEQGFDDEPGGGTLTTAVAGTYISPRAQWEPKESPIRVDGGIEGRIGRRYADSIDFNAVFAGQQAQRSMKYLLRDAQRLRTHTIVLSAKALGVLQLDTIVWSSVLHSYDAKRFEVASRNIDWMSMNITFVIREVDPTDHDFVESELIETESPAGGPEPRAAITVQNPAASPWSVPDKNGNPVAPAIRGTYTPDPIWDRVDWKLFLAADGRLVNDGTVGEPEDGEVIISGIVAQGTDYLLRFYPTARRLKTRPSDLLPVTTPGIGLAEAMIDLGLLTKIDEAAQEKADVAQALAQQFGQATSDVRLTINGRFGTGDLSGWRAASGTSATMVARVPDGAGTLGEMPAPYAVRLDTSGATGARAQLIADQLVPVTPGATLFGTVRAAPIGDGANPTLSLQPRFFDVAGQFLETPPMAQDVLSFGAWKQISGSIAVPPSAVFAGPAAAVDKGSGLRDAMVTALRFRLRESGAQILERDSVTTEELAHRAVVSRDWARAGGIVNLLNQAQTDCISRPFDRAEGHSARITASVLLQWEAAATAPNGQSFPHPFEIDFTIRRHLTKGLFLPFNNETWTLEYTATPSSRFSELVIFEFEDGDTVGGDYTYSLTAFPRGVADGHLDILRVRQRALLCEQFKKAT